MGGFINSQADNEICEVLNKRFSDDVNPITGQIYIAELRQFFQQAENLFDDNHHVHRVFHRLAVSVTGGTRIPRAKKSRFRWLFLLSKKIPQAVIQAIKGQLTSILSPFSGGNPAGATNYATFLTRHVQTGTGTFELSPQNSTTPTIFHDANGKTYCTIVLECNVDAALPDNDETDPPNADGGETNISARTKSYAKTIAKKKKATVKKTPAKKAKKGKSRR